MVKYWLLGGGKYRPTNDCDRLISGFHRTSLLSVTFINQLMHSIITVVDVKILLYKSLKDTH